MSEGRSAEKAECVETCRAVLEEASNRPGSPLFELPGRLLATDEWPAALASPTFLPIGARCPHGVQFWTYPDANLIEALTQMNEGRYTPAFCLCGVVDDAGDGTCGNCDRRIMTDDDALTIPPPGATS